MGRTSDAKERLIQAAMDLFFTRSYTDVGVQELCKAAAVKKGSFYHFFETKQDLVLASLDRWWEITRETAWERAFSSERPPLERISRFLNWSMSKIANFTSSTNSFVDVRLATSPWR